jgi:glycosyltransferase involved in cell wall biosynthesis
MRQGIIVRVSCRLAFFTRSLGGGGAERVVVTLASHYAAQGHAVDLIVSRREDTYLKEVHPEVRVHYLHTRRRMLAAPRLAKVLREVRPAALLATVNTFAAVLGQRLARTPTRVVLREATTPSIAFQVKETSALKRMISETAMRWLYPRADAVVAVSKGVAQDLLNLMPQLEPKLTVIYNPVIDAAFYAKADAPVEHPWFQPHQPPVVLAAGRLVALKGYDTLLRAFARVRQETPARLVILGEGPERPNLERLASELGVAADVDMPGFDPNPFRYMRRAGVFVLSSRYEGLPNVLIQALACGCPVVSTDCPSGPSEILDGGRYGALVPVDDVEAMAGAIVAALKGSNPQVPEAWLSQFAVPTVAHQYLEAILGTAHSL